MYHIYIDYKVCCKYKKKDDAYRIFFCLKMLGYKGLKLIYLGGEYEKN